MFYKIISKILLTILFVSCSNGAVAPKHTTDSDTSLDLELGNKQKYDEKKQEDLTQIKSLLKMSDLSDEQEYKLNRTLGVEYRKFTIDSAIYYMERNRDIANRLQNKRYLLETNLRLSMLYASAGMYIESQQIADSIDRQSLPSDILPLYYDSKCVFYNNYAQSNGNHLYFQLEENYRDSLLTILDKTDLRYEILFAETMLYKDSIDSAEKLLLGILGKINNTAEEYGTITYLLGNVYKKKENKDLQKHYYTLSTISDIEKSTKDNASVLSLALLYYEDQKIDEAYKLTKSAIEDAMFCNVRFRTVEISEIYDIINTAYQDKKAKQEEQSKRLLTLISVLSILLCLVIIYVYTQMKRVSAIKSELYRMNNKLKDLNEDIKKSNEALIKSNEALHESNHIKEDYIAHFFDLCSMYVEKLEDYRKQLNKTAMNGKLEELFKALKSTTLIDKELEELYKKFDSIFLSLYPTFVEEFNSLLKEDEKIIPRQGELLNTELRIFALIRLGITDSVKIASFLRYSLSTIYNYRTKVRNKAAVSRDEFEEIVTQIGRINPNR